MCMYACVRAFAGNDTPLVSGHSGARQARQKLDLKGADCRLMNMRHPNSRVKTGEAHFCSQSHFGCGFLFCLNFS